MKKIAITFLAFLGYTSCNAAELSIIGHGFSRHAVMQEFNQRNYGTALRYEDGKYAIQAGGFNNSLGNDSAYVGLDWSPIRFNVVECLNIEAGFYGGAATGYKYAVTPMAGIQAAARCKNVFVRVRAMPDVFYNSKVVGAVEVGLVLKRF